jgi:hypothetical protein
MLYVNSYNDVHNIIPRVVFFSSRKQKNIFTEENSFTTVSMPVSESGQLQSPWIKLKSEGNRFLKTKQVLKRFNPLTEHIDRKLYTNSN